MENLTLGQQMRQQDFGFRDEVIIDLFAGRGGASVAQQMVSKKAAGQTTASKN